MALLWVWALVGTVGLYRKLASARGELAKDESYQVLEGSSNARQNRLLQRLVAFEGRGLPWPKESAGVNLLSYLGTQANLAGLRVMRMGLEPPRKSGAQEAILATLELEGAPGRVVEFLVALEQGQYACSVLGMELAPGEGKLVSRLSLEFYLVNEKVLSRLKRELLALGAKAGEQESHQLAYYLPERLNRAFLIPKVTEASEGTVEQEPGGEWFPVYPEAPLAPDAGGKEPEQVPKEPEPLAPAVPVKPDPYRPTYRLRGIVYEEKGAMAILEGEYGAIEVVGKDAVLPSGEQVVAIGRRSVRLRYRGEEATVEVEK